MMDNSFVNGCILCNLGKELEETPIIIADVSSLDSLAEMCKQAKVILNCVGPVSYLNIAVLIQW